MAQASSYPVKASPVSADQILLLDSAASSAIKLSSVAPSGSWTPTDASGAGLALVGPSGVYFRLGNLVIAMFALTYPSTANGANATIGGLPFAASNTAPGRTGFISYTTMNVARTIVPDASAATATFWSLAGGGVPNSSMSTSIVQGTLIYTI